MLTTCMSVCNSQLSREHRTWVALYALETGRSSREEVLRLNEITEADIYEFHASWLRMRCRVPPGIAGLASRQRTLLQ